MFFTYILLNKTIDKFYVGSTSDLVQRVQEHNKPSHKSKFTRKQPGKWELVYYEKLLSRSESVKRERQIKSWKSRKKILQLVEQSRP